MDASPLAASPPERWSHPELLQSCREIALNRYRNALRVWLNATRGDARVNAPGSDQGLDASPSLREWLRVSGDRIALDFDAALAERLDRGFEGAPTVTADSRSQRAVELSIEPEESQSLRLDVERIGRRIRDAFPPQVWANLRARIDAIGQAGGRSPSLEGVAPEDVLQTLRQVMAPYRQDHADGWAAIALFEPHLSAAAVDVITHLDEHLAAAGVPSRPRIVRSLPGQAPRPRSAAAGGGGTMVGVGRFSPAQAPSWASDAAVPTTMQWAQLLALFEAGASTVGRSTVSGILANPKSFAPGALEFPAVAPELLQALKRLQARPGPADGGGVEALDAVRRQAHMGSGALDQLIIDAVTRVFENIHGEPKLANSIKRQLFRLQVVAIKAALLDRSFFARQEHPMRRLIDRLVEIGSDPSIDLKETAPLPIGVEALVSLLVTDFDHDLGLFDQALQQVEALALWQASREIEGVEEAVDRARRAEALWQLEERAKTELAARVDASTPMFVQRFVLEYWVRHMALTELEAASPEDLKAPHETPGWRDGLAVAELLLWSVAPKFADDVAALAANMQRLLGALQAGAGHASCPEAALDQFQGELMQRHMQLIRDAKDGRLVQRAASNLRLKRDGSVEFNPIIQGGFAEELRGLTEPSTDSLPVLAPGDLVEIESGDGRLRGWKLHWVADSGRQFVFARHPDRALLLERVTLNDLFRMSRARLTPNPSVVERAIDRLIGRSGRHPG